MHLATLTALGHVPLGQEALEKIVTHISTTYVVDPESVFMGLLPMFLLLRIVIVGASDIYDPYTYQFEQAILNETRFRKDVGTGYTEVFIDFVPKEIDTDALAYSQGGLFFYGTSDGI